MSPTFEPMRYCNTCGYCIEGICEGLHSGRHVGDNSCIGHSEGNDHLISNKVRGRRHHLQPVEIDRIRKLYLDGWIVADIAKHLEVSACTVKRYTKNLVQKEPSEASELYHETFLPR